jgi:hypothetical protein
MSRCFQLSPSQTFDQVLLRSDAFDTLQSHVQSRVEPALRRAIESSQAPAVKLRIVEALLWLHLPNQPTVTPALLRSVVHAASAANLVPGYAGSQCASQQHNISSNLAARTHCASGHSLSVTVLVTPWYH